MTAKTSVATSSQESSTHANGMSQCSRAMLALAVLLLLVLLPLHSSG
jgi:hypothetical protein